MRVLPGQGLAWPFASASFSGIRAKFGSNRKRGVALLFSFRCPVLSMHPPAMRAPLVASDRTHPIDCIVGCPWRVAGLRKKKTAGRNTRRFFKSPTDQPFRVSNAYLLRSSSLALPSTPPPRAPAPAPMAAKLFNCGQTGILPISACTVWV